MYSDVQRLPDTRGPGPFTPSLHAIANTVFVVETSVVAGMGLIPKCSSKVSLISKNVPEFVFLGRKDDEGRELFTSL